MGIMNKVLVFLCVLIATSAVAVPLPTTPALSKHSRLAGREGGVFIEGCAPDARAVVYTEQKSEIELVGLSGIIPDEKTWNAFNDEDVNRPCNSVN